MVQPRRRKAPPLRKPCRVFLVGEGTSDIGDLALPVPHRGTREGFLQPVLRKFAGAELALTFEGAKLSTLARTKVRTAAALYARHAAQAFVLAEQQSCDAVVFSNDVDKTSGARPKPREARTRIEELHRSVERGFSDARRESPTEIATIVATPCRMIEAWALADPRALASVAGEAIDPAECRDPESLWGDESRAESRHPKNVLRRLVGSPPDFAAIAQEADLAALERDCPLSFRPFARAVREAVLRCVRRSRSGIGVRG